MEVRGWRQGLRPVGRRKRAVAQGSKLKANIAQSSRLKGKDRKDEGRGEMDERRGMMEEGS